MPAYQDERTFEDDALIVAEGDNGPEMFVVQEGRVAVTKRIGDEEILLATLERGDFFGEMSLLESLPRSATVRAVGRTRLLALRAGDLLMKIRRDPTFAFEMLQQMSGRIRHLHDAIGRLQRPDDAEHEAVTTLAMKAEYPSRQAT